MRGQIVGLLGAACMLLGAARGVGAQDIGTISGRVVDAASQSPVAGAMVRVEGTTRGGLSREDGAFSITGVAPGTVTVRATRIGYAPATQQVAVAAGQTATITISMTAAATTLEQVVVTATGEEQRVREQGNAVAIVELPQERLAAVPNFSSAIAGQAAGVQVLQSGGTSGTGARVRIRGANSLSLSNEPLIIIDGVRVNSSAESSSISTGGQTPSRLNDINPEDIESIEILKGPAASGLYGTQAANGVIQITTKRGASGAPQWTFWAEAGTIRENNAYPANYGGWYTDEDGEAAFGCDLTSVGAGLCTQDSLAAFNPLEVNSPFRNGVRSQYGLSVAGGTDRLTYYVSGELEDESGIYRTNSLDKINLRGNFRLGLAENLTATVTAGFLSSDQELPQNDNNFLGYVSNGIAGTALPDGGVDEDGYDPVGPRTIDQIDWNQQNRRFISSVNADYRPLSWLRITGTAGIDLLNRYDNETLPRGAVRLDADTEAGERTSNRLQFSTWTTNISGIAEYSLTPNLAATTTLGFQYQRELLEGTFAFGAGLATPGLGGATERFENDENYADNRLAGGILTQQLAWQDRLYLTLGVRGDDNSAFGENFGTIFYPSAQLSWVASEEDWFPQPTWLSSFRLRGAFGQSGLRPGNRDAITYFSPVPVRVEGSEEPGITVGGVGDPELKPERTTEYEVGFDLSAFGQRLTLDAGYYNKQSKDALVSTRTAPSAGVSSTIFRNLGSMRNQGVELQLTAIPVDRPNLLWSMTVTHSENRNEVEDLGGNPPIIFGLGGASQRHMEGYSAGGYWGTVIEGYSDTDGDGIVDDITYSDEEVFIGHSQPQRMTSLQSEITLFGAVRVSGMLDYRGGYKQYNGTEEFRCAIFTCRGLNDRTAPLDLQARSIAAGLDGVYAGFIEDADFFKLREVAVTFLVPERYTNRLNVSNLSLTLAGQNLGTWTDYTGLDPEINFAGQANYSQADFLSQPQVRRFTARVNVNF